MYNLYREAFDFKPHLDSNTRKKKRRSRRRRNALETTISEATTTIFRHMCVDAVKLAKHLMNIEKKTFAYSVEAESRSFLY